MIIVMLTGGLGNQMFQYAAARRLAHVTGQDLKLDHRWFSWRSAAKTPRCYELGVFALKAEAASAEESRWLRGGEASRSPKLVKRILAVVGYKAPASYRKEMYFQFDPHVLQITGDAYLDGYWQSEKYFSDTEQIIRSDFRLKAEPHEGNAEILTEIQSCESVSIHFRRGDYVTNPQSAACHGILPLSYYQAALEVLQKQLVKPRLFVFSDDLPWVREHLRTDLPLCYVEGNGTKSAAEDLRLMSACRHHIIANSSFSWWGAWLGTNPEKIVVAPDAWFSTHDINTSDLIPESWLRI
jgi:hypothetical protein